MFAFRNALIFLIGANFVFAGDLSVNSLNVPILNLNPSSPATFVASSQGWVYIDKSGGKLYYHSNGNSNQPEWRYKHAPVFAVDVQFAKVGPNTNDGFIFVGRSETAFEWVEVHLVDLISNTYCSTQGSPFRESDYLYMVISSSFFEVYYKPNIPNQDIARKRLICGESNELVETLASSAMGPGLALNRPIGDVVNFESKQIGVFMRDGVYALRDVTSIMSSILRNYETSGSVTPLINADLPIVYKSHLLLVDLRAKTIDVWQSQNFIKRENLIGSFDSKLGPNVAVNSYAMGISGNMLYFFAFASSSASSASLYRVDLSSLLSTSSSSILTSRTSSSLSSLPSISSSVRRSSSSSLSVTSSTQSSSSSRSSSQWSTSQSSSLSSSSRSSSQSLSVVSSSSPSNGIIPALSLLQILTVLFPPNSPSSDPMTPASSGIISTSSDSSMTSAKEDSSSVGHLQSSYDKSKSESNDLKTETLSAYEFIASQNFYLSDVVETSLKSQTLTKRQPFQQTTNLTNNPLDAQKYFLYLALGGGILVLVIIVFLAFKRTRKTSKRFSIIESKLKSNQRKLSESSQRALNSSGDQSIMRSTATFSEYSSPKNGTDRPKLPASLVSEYNTTMSSMKTTAFGSDSITKIASGDQLFLPGYLLCMPEVDFKLGDLLAKGGGGDLYKASMVSSQFRQNNVVGDCVVKVIKTANDNESDQEVKYSFLQEVAILTMVSKKRYFSEITGYCPNPRMILLKFYQYGSLSDAIQGKSATITLELATALSILHQTGIVHLDIKPANILLDPLPENPMHVVLCDFGIAQVIDEKLLAVKQMKLSRVFGASLVYASPEILRMVQTRSVDLEKKTMLSSDVYSFSMTIYEIWVRKQPFYGITDAEAIQRMILSGYKQPVPAELYNSQEFIVRASMMVFNKCSAFNPMSRPSMSEVVVVLGNNGIKYLSTLKTFSNQSKIPRLPIPKLEDTIQKYLQSLRPLLSKEELARSSGACEQFLNGLGPVLQQRLIEYEKKQKNSWLEDIWLHKAYWEWREPLMINSNWWLQFKDSAEIEESVKSPPPKGEFTSIQLRRASIIITKLLDFKDLLEKEEIPPQTMGRAKIPLCMNQYRMQFGVSRIPAIPSDYIYQEFPAKSKHIILLLEDQIYLLRVLGKNGERFTQKSIELMLGNVLALHKSLEERQPAVGLLTSDNRDKWAKLREHLEKLSDRNRNNLQLIDQSLFAVCLDNFSTSEDVDLSHRVIFHGSGGRNRWFDKSLSFIFMSNGRGGCNGEHSPSDAVIPGTIMEYILKNEDLPSEIVETKDLKMELPELIEWDSDDLLQKSIEQSGVRAEEDIEDLDSVLLHYNKYGADIIKSVIKAPPDAFVQMVMQLAYFRTYDHPCATYESASTRQFLHGRTETIRSCSKESLEFTKAFDSPKVTVEEKKELLRKALEAHSKYAKDATNALGVDRHFLGLRMMQTSKDAKQEIFTDEAFMKSVDFKLSTSNVSPGDYYYGGFGPIVPDGYGINYAIGQNTLKFSISTRRKSTETCSRSFRKVLEGSLEDLLKLFQ